MKTAYSELTNEELAVLARNDRSALEHLVCQNVGFAKFMASEFQNRCGNYNRNDIEDYSQICFFSIMKAVKNFDPDRGTRFITYAGQVMRNDMLKQLKDDNKFRKYITDEYIEENDTTDEECEEEYGDAYDNRFETRRSYVIERMVSAEEDVLGESVLIEVDQIDNEAQSARLGQYSSLINELFREETPEQPDTSSKEQKDKVVYITNKETEYSWKYPIFYKALRNMQIEVALKELLDEHFDPAQKEYLIYRFGLKNLTPRTLQEAAEHFHLPVSYAKKIEKKGLEKIKNVLTKKILC